MRKLIFVLFLLSVSLLSGYGQDGKLEVGMKVPDWIFTDADGKEFTMDSWAGKVLQINYVDPDVADLNDPLNDAIHVANDVEKRINDDRFKGFGIVDCKSTWKPNVLIRLIAGGKAKKYGTTILFDYKGTLHGSWGMPKDSYNVVIVDKNRICRYIHSGEVPDSEFENIIKLIIDLENE